MTDAVIAVVAGLHIGFMVLEMFLWTHPAGRRLFATSADFAVKSARLAANQGLYNGFLAAGLLWGWFLQPRAVDITSFFLGCIVVAGCYAAVTVKPAIFWIQALPAGLALALLLVSG